MGFIGGVQYCVFWRGHSPLKAVGYEDAGYGNSAHRKRDLKAGFGRENYSRRLR